MKTFGLIGYPLSHSFSKKFFTDKFIAEKILDCSYELFPIEHIGQIEQIIAEHPNLRGLNVTIPHKLNVMPFLDDIAEDASQIGAVNCISFSPGKEKPFLRGHNTDAYGFEHSLVPLLKSHHQKALVFGDGGAAQAVKYVLKKLNISFEIVLRKPDSGKILYSDIDASVLSEFSLLINTTPLGMSPNIDTVPQIPYNFLDERHLAYDLVYNPEQTLFLKMASERGAAIKNGLEMLILQAERSWVIWNEVS